MLRLKIKAAEFAIAAIDFAVPYLNHALYRLHRKRKDMLMAHFEQEIRNAG